MTVLQQPLDRVYVASTGMMSIIDAIGALDHVKLVATDVEKMNAGEILYSGDAKEPDYEMMVDSGVQFHIDSAMLDGSPEVIEKEENKTTKRRSVSRFFVIIILLLALLAWGLVLNVYTGSVDIPAGEVFSLVWRASCLS